MATTNPPRSWRAGPVGALTGALLTRLYGSYVLALLAVLVSVAALLAFALPSLVWRRAATRGLARSWLVLAGLRLRVSGRDALPAGSCVLVANHASYLDGIILNAALPPRFGFVVKREAAAMPVVGLLLRRLGSEFVDRHTRGGRQRDGRRVVERAGQGHSLVFFPEGTFDTQVGLKRFHIGAFVAAARGGTSIVPAVIHGARRALPSGTLVPSPGAIHVEMLGSIDARGAAPDALRDASRARILERLGEPDLAGR